MNGVVTFNTLLVEVLTRLAAALGFGCVATEAWATFTHHGDLVDLSAALALTLLFASLFIRRLVP